MRSLIVSLAFVGWLGFPGCSHPPEPQVGSHAPPLDAVNRSMAVDPPDRVPDASLAPDIGRGLDAALAPDGIAPVL
jgi:hypothetical protein